MQVQGADFQLALADAKIFLHPVLGAIQVKHAGGREREIVGSNQIATILLHSVPEFFDFDLPFEHNSLVFLVGLDHHKPPHLTLATLGFSPGLHL